MPIAKYKAGHRYRENLMSRTNQRGISILQGIFGLAIISITSLSTAPLYYRMLGDRHVVAFTNELVGALQQARHLAVKEMSPVSLCSSNNGRDCTQTPWSEGYIAFYDAGQPGVIDGNDRIVYAVQPRTAPVRVVLNGADHIRFLQNGGVLADASSSGYRRPGVHAEQPAALASLLSALSPVSTAHAADAESMATEQPVAFLVCSGQIGRAIRVTAIGRLDTSKVACR
jgi:Tfp pilus assembly protein FimT